jgi:hypothetical protein
VIAVSLQVFAVAILTSSAVELVALLWSRRSLAAVGMAPAGTVKRK